MSIIKLNNQGVKNATAFGSITGLGSMTFIKKLTASSSSTVSFVDGASSVVLDNTYKEYVFTFKDIHASNDSAEMQFNISVDGGSNYNVTKTSAFVYAYKNEADNGIQAVEHVNSYSLSQSTDPQVIEENAGTDNDQSIVGTLTLYNPSSTTFVKHYMATLNNCSEHNYNKNSYVGGYGNTTSAVNAIQFSMSAGTIDAGDICLYGIA